MRSALRHLLAALAVGLCAAGCACSAPAAELRAGEDAGRVVRVVDGDTIRVALASGEEAVRYIGVDTPESVKPGSPVECLRSGRARSTGAYSPESWCAAATRP